ncbi:MAG TPA: NADP-dependent oxidoreductase [Acidimicrobiales bacterium]|nr:NADP-dependent oxidoreductase [Acidimicrobiales bacterium]
MRAITLGSFAGIDGLGFTDWPEPTPGSGDEVVTVRAVALGPWDLNATDGYFASMGGASDFPQQQGWDFAGETTSGRRVLGFVAQPWMGTGSLSERIAVPAALLTDLPEGLSWSQGAALPVCALTAQLLVEGAGVSEGDRVAVTGAAGIVGGLAVQLARARGLRVAGVVRAADAEEARRLGVETVLDTTGTLEHSLGDWAPGGVDACLDTAGLGSSVAAGVRAGGHLLTTVPGTLPAETEGITASVVQVQPDPGTLAALARSAADGRLTVRIAETLSWDEYRRGYEMLRAGGLRGKVVLTL